MACTDSESHREVLSLPSLRFHKSIFIYRTKANVWREFTVGRPRRGMSTSELIGVRFSGLTVKQVTVSFERRGDIGPPGACADVSARSFAHKSLVVRSRCRIIIVVSTMVEEEQLQ
jgi:hypothetical protein